MKNQILKYNARRIGRIKKEKKSIFADNGRIRQENGKK